MRTLLCAAVVAPGLAGAGDALADPRGIWETEGGTSHVRLADCGNEPKRHCGTIIWMKNPRKDVKNDNERLRDRELVGTRVVWDLEHQGGRNGDGRTTTRPTATPTTPS